MFLRNCWYMVGWSTDIPAARLTPLSVLDEPLVAYRKRDGGLAVLEDLCCHRLAPLSLGRQENDDVRCMYHGLKFAPDGRCVEIPGQARVAAAVKVRSYPVAERHGAAWVWMGTPEKADPALIPPIVGPDDPDWALVCSSMDIEAHASLVWDNLLDLSHAPFVHANTFGGGDAQAFASLLEGETTADTTVFERGVHVERWHVNRPSNPYLGKMLTDDLAVNDFIAPGVFILKTRCYAAGVRQRSAERIPSEEPLLARQTSQMITPLTERKTRLFFDFGPWAKAAEHRDKFFPVAQRAFLEDKLFIERQQQMMDRMPERRVMPLAMDVPIVRFHEIMKRLLAEDRTAQSPAPKGAPKVEAATAGSSA
ncbi:MAG TPA: aromatic ring-hydroxylating dioxygenase subunit alpha [Steroidobacteraceae bacterium]|nr:aromatic ring-hydroxylating dioxygenase subunit alpha [Steroidobacteraceae bacterium]